LCAISHGQIHRADEHPRLSGINSRFSTALKRRGSRCHLRLFAQMVRQCDRICAGDYCLERSECHPKRQDTLLRAAPHSRLVIGHNNWGAATSPRSNRTIAWDAKSPVKRDAIKLSFLLESTVVGKQVFTIVAFRRQTIGNFTASELFWNSTTMSTWRT
jgi:hypothetical protein